MRLGNSDRRPAFRAMTKGQLDDPILTFSSSSSSSFPTLATSAPSPLMRPTVLNSKFIGCTAVNLGGAIFTGEDSIQLTFSNCIFDSCLAPQGGVMSV